MPSQAELPARLGPILRLRFAFQSDSFGVYPGVYLDDILVE